MAIRIELTKGYAATIDDADFELVSQYKWCAHVKPHTVYAKTNVRSTRTKSGFEMLLMHHLIMGPQPAPKMSVDHFDQNGLNNQRDNLRWATKSEQGKNRRKYDPTKAHGVERGSNGFYTMTVRHEELVIVKSGISTKFDAMLMYDCTVKRHNLPLPLNFPDGIDEYLWDYF